MTIPAGLRAHYAGRAAAEAQADRREQVSPAVAALRTAIYRSIHPERRAA